MITQSELKSVVTYDKDTGIFLLINDGHLRKAGENPCRLHRQENRSERFYISILGKGFWAHKLAFLYVYGRYPNKLEPIDGDYKNLKLCNFVEINKVSANDITTQEARRLLDYNQETGDFTWKRGGGSRVKGSIAGHVAKNESGKSYLNITIRGCQLKAHRLAFIWMGEDPPEQVDHDDGNGLNNSWINLNRSNQINNSKNCKLQNNNSSGVPDICFESKSGLWRVRISLDKKRISLGRYENFFDACCARKSAEIRYGYHRNHGSIRPLY
jgi:hypothetical protein